MKEFESTIPTEFERQVLAHPDKIAINTSDKSLSYVELNARANQLARRILDGVEQVVNTDPIVLLLEQGIDMIAAILAVLKSGKCFIPIDPSDPETRTAYILKNSGAHTIITSHRHCALIKTSALNATKIIMMEEPLEGICESNLCLTLPAQAIAYILYTSGSTGEPKGVVQAHHSVLHNMRLHRLSFAITSDDVQSLLYGSSVYGGIRDSFNALLNGATLAIYPLREQGFSELTAWLQTKRITILCCVATVFRQFMSHVAGVKTFPDIRLVKLGGEATYLAEVEAFQHCFSSNCVLHCGLGSTETGLARQYFVEKNTCIEQNTVPLGFPVADKEILLLDDDFNPVREGDIGEIVIKSKYIAQGYWKNKAITEGVFSIDADGETRLYRTGDLGLIGENGCLYHRGRKDQQVKIRGFRVELGEVEVALRVCSKVHDVAVTSFKDERMGAKIVAYVVVKKDSVLNVNELRQFMLSQLPNHMLPKRYIFLDSLPLTANGKINRRVLPEPSLESWIGNQCSRRASSELESRCVQIWEQVLEVDGLGIDDDFFELGGDSLLAAELILKMEVCLGRPIPLAVLVRSRTIAELITCIDQVDDPIKSFALAQPESESSRPPLICVYGLMLYKPLADLLASEIVTYGIYLDSEFDLLRSKKFYGVELPSVSELATMYIYKIREIQPKGPYYLAGLSFGGFVAFEIARQLQEAGEKVQLLALMDAYAPGASKPSSLRGWIYQYRQRISWWFSNFSLRVNMFKVKTAKQSKAVERQYLRNIRRQIKARAIREYRPCPISGRGVLFKASDALNAPGFKTDAHLGWNNKFSEGVEVHTVPGDHLSILQPPNVRVMADKLLSYMVCDETLSN
ncbi:MAG: AMP-binding protein [Spongiibacteraceae bacterium]|nr:AMP-binding protein [Spongiibacteraceae bacterium]